MQESVNRVKFIDIAKGIGILLVVWQHISVNDILNPFFKTRLFTVLTSFHMPLFFLISGIFFSNKDTLFFHLKKKIKRLLIPFFLFYLTTSCFLPWIMYRFGFSNEAIHWNSLYAFYSPEYFPNGPIWFLLALFWTDILFFFEISFIRNKIVVCLIALILGIIGCSLGTYGINLPMYLDTALVALPFFCTGYYARYLIEYFDAKVNDRRLLLMISVILGLITYQYAPSVNMMMNGYTANFIYFYIISICGILTVFMLSKCMQKSHILIQLGIDSIIILLTHSVLVNLFFPIVHRVISNYLLVSSIVLLLILFCEYWIVKIFNRYLGFMIGK